MVGIATLQADFRGLAALTVLILAALRHTGIPLASMAREMRYFVLLLVLVFIARALSTPGEALLSAAGVSVTREGVLAGGRVCWRPACVAAAAILFVVATRPSELRGAVIWLLAPVPGIPERRAGTMISLLVRFIPMVLDQARETSDAQRARCIECRKNPVARMAVLTIALLRRIFEDADRLVAAMEARCYSEDRTGPAFGATRLDWLVLLGAVLFCAGLFLVP